MDATILPLKDRHADQAIQSEWTHQLSAIERTLNFFEEYFLWSTQQLDLIDIETLDGGSPECLKFFQAEAPIVLGEAKETIQLLLLLNKNAAQDKTTR